MNRLLARAGAALVLLVVGAGVSAQTCRNDIPATAPNERFTDHGDGTVTDVATGLMWKQCTEGLSGAGCATGVAGSFTWQQALQAADAASFAGYTDWRLPNKNELESLVERRCYNPAINVTFYPNTASNWYWSSSPYAGNPDDAWGVHFYDGFVSVSNKDVADRVRLVRAGQ